MDEMDDLKNSEDRAENIQGHKNTFSLEKLTRSTNIGKSLPMASKKNDIYGENYRVEIYLSEIYKSVYVSHIEYYGEGMQRISKSTRIDFEKMSGITNEQTNNSMKLLYIITICFNPCLQKGVVSLKQPKAYLKSKTNSDKVLTKKTYFIF